MDISIESNIAFTMSCPLCNDKSNVSLGMIHRKKTVACPNCKTPMVLTPDCEWLNPFVSDFDVVY